MLVRKTSGGDESGIRRACVRSAVEIISGGRLAERVWYA